MKNTTGILSLLLCCSFLFLSGCMLSGGPNTTMVNSPDGIASLHLEGIVLPDGIKAQDIRIEPIPTDAEEGLQAGVAYNFLPEGIVFDQPVTLTLTLPLSQERIIPFVMHSTENGTEVVDNIIVTEDMSAKTMTIEASISHFSKIWTTNHGFKTTTIGGGEYPVGGSVPLKITVTPTGSDVGIWNKERKRYYGADIKKDTTYTIGDITFLNTGFGKQPIRIDVPSIPGKKDISLDTGATFYTSFFCESVGAGTVQTTVGIEYTIEYYPDRGYANVATTKRESSGSTSYILKNTYTCADDLMIQLTPYTFICPNGGPGRSGVYLSDPSTGELITNAAGEKLDSVTGVPIPPCPRI